MSLEMFSRSVVDKTIVHFHNWRLVMRHWNLRSILCLSLLLLTAPFANAAKPDALVRLPGHVLPALAKATPVALQSKAVAEEPLTLTLVLKRDDQVGFERYLREVYDPSSPTYRKFLTQSDISDRFGPSREAFDDVLSYLQESGFTLEQGSANRLTLTVRGARAQAERAFGVHILDFQAGDSRFFANDRDRPCRFTSPRTLKQSSDCRIV